MNNWHNSVCDHCGNSWVCTGCTKLQDKFSNLCKANFYSCLNENETTDNFDYELEKFDNNIVVKAKKLANKERKLNVITQEYQKINDLVDKTTHKTDNILILNNKNQLNLLSYTKDLIMNIKNKDQDNIVLNALSEKILKYHENVVKDIKKKRMWKI